MRENIMSYIIYNTESTIIAGSRYGYATARAAKGQLTKLIKAGEIEGSKEDFSVEEYNYFFEAVEKKVKRKVLEGMGGGEYWEGVNTPNYMSPACESYWSM